MDSSTTAVTISADGYVAEIGLRGGQLLSLTSTNPATGTAQDLIVPTSGAQGAFAGSVLAPWPNRIVDATYVYEGTTYTLEANDSDSGAAIHGLLYDLDFVIQKQRESEVHLISQLQPSPGYPFRLDLVLTYRVAGFLGLATTLAVRYVPEKSPEVVDPDVPVTEGRAEEAEQPSDATAAETDPAAAEQTTDDVGSPAPATSAPTAPFGVGFHPYLTAGGAPLKSCRLRLPAQTIAKTKTTGKMVSRKTVSGDFDLTEGQLLSGLRIDHAYTDLPEDGWTAELTHGPSGLMVRMISDTAWAQIYTGDQIDRAGVAVEPMTCPPNAFNTGDDLIQLAPNEWRRFGYSIEAFRL